MNQVSQIGRYLLREKIGSGTMAAVYRADDPLHQIEVALKVLHAHSHSETEIVRRFKQEANAAASLQHPYIIQVYDSGCDGQHHYIVMDYISGGTLLDILEARPVLSPREAVSLLSKIADALHQAHQLQLVHRDVKPANILIDEHGHPILSDFGIARVHENNLTNKGQVLGTPNYMSPEQVTGEVVSGASDIYGLGVVLFEVLTGKLPFTAEDKNGVMYQHVHQPVPRPRSINPAIPPALEKVILTALEKKPQDRFSTAQEMAQAMEASLIRIPGGKYDKIIATGIGLLLLVLFIGTFSYFYSITNTHTTEEANEAVAQQPTHTQEPTHTTMPDMPTSTPRPTYTPPPKLEVDPSLVRPAGRPTLVQESPTATPAPTETMAAVEPTQAKAPAVPTETTVMQPARQAPVATQVPAPRQAPVATQVPAPTQAPVATQVPAPTQMPVLTRAPAPTQTGVATEVTEFPTAAPMPTQTVIARKTAILPTATSISPTVVPSATATAIPASATATAIPASATATSIPATASPTPTVIPASPTATATATPIPPSPTPTFAGYNNAPRPLSPIGGEVIQSENVTFEWMWNDQPLQPTHQFVLMGVRDGQKLRLGEADGSQRSMTIPMRNFGHFETDWQWYVMIVDENGNMIQNTKSADARLGISLPQN